MKKLTKRSIMTLSIINFVLSLWFSQYVTNTWLRFVYVVGSLVLMCGLMALSE